MKSQLVNAAPILTTGMGSVYPIVIILSLETISISRGRRRPCWQGVRAS
jgi:hypothetical protein